VSVQVAGRRRRLGRPAGVPLLPSELVVCARSGLLVELGIARGDVERCRVRGCDVARCTQHMARAHTITALLDVLDTEAEASRSVRVDMRAHGRVLLEALERQLAAQLEALGRRARHPEPARRSATYQDVARVCDALAYPGISVAGPCEYSQARRGSRGGHRWLIAALCCAGCCAFVRACCGSRVRRYVVGVWPMSRARCVASTSCRRVIPTQRRLAGARVNPFCPSAGPTSMRGGRPCEML
jgi:hypothetical protein